MSRQSDVSVQPSGGPGRAHPTVSRRSFLAGVGAVGLAITAVGCGGQKEAPATPTKPVEPATLTLGLWTNPTVVEFIKKFNVEFERKYPGVTIQLQTAPTANGAWTTLYNSLVAGKTVDILADYPRVPAAWPPSYTGMEIGTWNGMITSGQLLNLSHQPFMKDYNLTLERYAMGYRNGIYGLMIGQFAHGAGVWYKRDLLNKYGLHIPGTFSEFIAQLKKFKGHGLTPVFSGAPNAFLWLGIEWQLLMQGHHPAEASTVALRRAEAFWKGEQSWTDSVYQETSAKYQQISQYFEPGATGVVQLTAPGLWATKEDDYPFFLDGSWDGPDIAKANPELKFGYFVIPATDTQQASRIPVSTDFTWEAPTWTKHKDLVLDYISLFSQKQNFKGWLGASSSVSLQPDVSMYQPWMSWLNANRGGFFPELFAPWVPPGAARGAALPDLSKMTPVGGMSVQQTLTQAADAYRSSVKH